MYLFVIFPNLNKVEVEVEVKNIMECLNGSDQSQLTKTLNVLAL